MRKTSAVHSPLTAAKSLKPSTVHSPRSAAKSRKPSADHRLQPFDFAQDKSGAKTYVT
jgi:hypothetical protein